ncbi:hypothetical protein HPULCUR_011241 [Helicostylum pulchrum]|uniref:Transmembrane protein n=1 Tax=Helicostylum pulchrum TaxID=562976 RepID=A0ABP9YHH2_9FUNG
MGVSSGPVFTQPGLVGPDTLEIISEFISLVCITVLASAIGSKTFGEKIKTINYGRIMLTFRNIYLEPDGKCTIGLQLIASVPLLVYDFLLNLYLTWLFMAPLMNVGLTSRANWKRSRLYKLARRTLVSSIVSLLISFANVLVVVITHGHERGLVCLTMCTVDVTINAVVVHWVTTNRSSNSKDSKNKTFHTADHMSAELTFDAPDPGDNHPKFEFASIQGLDRDSKLNEEDDSSGESIRSTQISHLSAKPLHSY